jgi:alpha-beta hydrolase superfamily lysophospholipase
MSLYAPKPRFQSLLRPSVQALHARGDARSFGASVKDVDRFIRHIESEHGIASQDVAIVAQSMAAVVVAT